MSDDHTHSPHAVREVEEALSDAGFRDCTACKERFVEHHESVSALLRSLKSIGAGNASPMGARRLASRNIMKKMIDIYEGEFGREGFVPATYDVIYASGIKAQRY